MSLRLAVFASGGGSNLQSLLDNLNGRTDAWVHIRLVVSDRSDAGALERARRAQVQTTIIEVPGRTEAEIASEMLEALDAHGIDVIALAGYLRLVPRLVVERFRGRIVNIHPALLPSFGGKGMYGARVHRAVLESGSRVTGVTVHHVDERFDEGKPVAQWPVPVLHDDTVESLASRVLAVEHILYPLALELLGRELEGRPVTRSLHDGLHGPWFNWLESKPDARAMRRSLGLD